MHALQCRRRRRRRRRRLLTSIVLFTLTRRTRLISYSFRFLCLLVFLIVESHCNLRYAIVKATQFIHHRYDDVFDKFLSNVH
jgi:hypothetical protein